MSAPEMWRVVDPLGGVREVPVRVEGERMYVGAGPARAVDTAGTPGESPPTAAIATGSGGLSGAPGTFPGTMVETSLRASLDAAVAAGDYATAEGLLALLRAAARPAAEVVDLAARRARGG